MTVTINGSGSITEEITIDGVTVGQGGGNVSTNTAVGASALDANTTGNRNTVVGSTAGAALTSGSRNTVLGDNCLTINTTGNDNVSIGDYTMRAYTGSSSTAVGAQAMGNGTSNSGDNNTAIGAGAMNANASGASNTAVGSSALTSNTTASDNTAVGYEAAKVVTTGGNNTIIGRRAAHQLTTGTTNAFLGYNSGNAITTGSKNTIIGSYTGNQGGLDIRTSSNNIVLSDGDGNPRLYYTAADNSWKSIEIYNNTTGSAANMVSLASGTIARSTSSLKYKRDVADASHGLAEVLQLRSVTYKGKSIHDGETVFGGLIAEEVHDAGLTEFVQYAEDGSPDSLAYGNMVSLCIKAIQELKAEVDSLKAQLNP